MATREKREFLRLLHSRKKEVDKYNLMMNTFDLKSKMSITQFKVSLKLLSCATLVLIIAIITVNTNYCLCDTAKTSYQRQTDSSKNLISSSSDNQTKMKNKLRLKEENKASLISSLSENIERQHFQMKPVRTFLHQRPSKFDSGEDISDQFRVPFSTAIQNYSSTFVNKGRLKSPDDGMRNIMSMHDFAAQSQKKLVEYDGYQSSANTILRNITLLKPISSVSNVVSSNKMFSHLFSYLAPNNSIQKQFAKSVKEINQTASKSNSTVRINPYAARSNTQGSLANSLFGLDLKPINFKRKHHVTSAPQRLYLAKPTMNSKLFVSTQPTTLLSENELAAKVTTNKVNNNHEDLIADSSSLSSPLNTLPIPNLSDKTNTFNAKNNNFRFKNDANHMAHSYIQDSFRGLLTLTQLPILPNGQISTAPSIFERKNKFKVATNDTNSDTQRRAIDELYRFAYILATGMRRKRDPLMALSSTPPNQSFLLTQKGSSSQRNQKVVGKSVLNHVKSLKSFLSADSSTKKAKPRGVMWDIASDPTLAVTVFHLLERASVALPLGFLLLPIVQMIRNPTSGISLGRILPPRASHRSVDYEELAKRLDVVDKMLSRALRSTHRESFIG